VLAGLLKALPIPITAMAPIERAISTAGGIAVTEVDEDFRLTQRPGVFLAGEMLDWEAPTGGYLLQACLSTGVAAASGVLTWLAVAPTN
jgi:predicted flavoprotein YhiN